MVTVSRAGSHHAPSSFGSSSGQPRGWPAHATSCKGFLSQPATKPNQALPPSTYRFVEKRTPTPDSNCYPRNVSGKLPTSHLRFGPPDHRIQTPLPEANISGWSPDLASAIEAEKVPMLHPPRYVHRTRLVDHASMHAVPETAPFTDRDPRLPNHNI